MMQYRSKQQGAVLIISLILLLVITMVGLSGISTTGLEEKMASNWQTKNLVFQAADAAIEDGLADNTMLWKAYLKDKNPETPETATITNTDTRITGSVEVEFKDDEIAFGSSRRQGAAGIQDYHFYVTGNANILSAKTSSVHVRGAYVSGTSLNSGLSSMHKVL
ncbi:pilus assembly PilX family protein [Oceanicoccus sagamiensis]|uniref:Type 4 fimbrial biogenesis protein PilX N-terminal domain-containing protein n=1 Tax=Oceanicoccus sagamiensis TaxID=716816 RepID=A0A1X9NCZ0_9GAMM|nr:PilX N-terminal domain-containing pilus assembly protein [Oceanicoccus sagamiensis]ARN72827.1 hypothetical protein BST96_01120 [Oceanicoccus sagamiensis]